MQMSLLLIHQLLSASLGDLESARKRLEEEIKRVKESMTKDDELCKV